MEAKVSELFDNATKKERDEDYLGAIELLSTLLNLPDASPEEKADALLSRAVNKRRVENNRRASLDDLNLVLQLNGIAAKQKAAALYERALAKQWCGDFRGAFADHSAILAMSDALPAAKAKALLARAETQCELNNQSGELADINAVLAMPDAPGEHRAMALFQRGYFQQCVRSDVQAAASDYRAALQVTGVTDRVRKLATEALESTQ